MGPEVLVVWCDAQPGKGWAGVLRVGERILLGRAPTCEIGGVRAMSRQHAQISRLPSGRYELRDLNSSSGIFHEASRQRRNVNELNAPERWRMATARVETRVVTADELLAQVPSLDFPAQPFFEDLPRELDEALLRSAVASTIERFPDARLRLALGLDPHRLNLFGELLPRDGAPLDVLAQGALDGTPASAEHFLHLVRWYAHVLQVPAEKEAELFAEAADEPLAVELAVLLDGVAKGTTAARLQKILAAARASGKRG